MKAGIAYHHYEYSAIIQKRYDAGMVQDKSGGTGTKSWIQELKV